ncbi:MAG: CvpA family protein [Limisphaerales bacterium]
MIMIGAEIPNLALDNLPVNWFDGVVGAMLIIGFFRGRKRGMTKEMLPLLKWVSLVLVCGLWYQMAAQLLVNTASLSQVPSDIFGYLLLAFVVVLVFMFFKWLLASRLGDKSLFGGGEYYLGMLAGMIRFACMLVAVLALLNAPVYTAQDIKQHEAYVKRWFGGGLYSGNYFPSLYTIQDQVFAKSYTGPYIKDYLGPLLIEAAPPPAAKPEPKPAVINIKK